MYLQLPHHPHHHLRNLLFHHAIDFRSGISRAFCTPVNISSIDSTMRSNVILSLLSFAPQLSLQLPPGKIDALVNHPRTFSTLDESLAVTVLQQQQDEPGRIEARVNDSCDKCPRRKCKAGRFRDPTTCKCVSCPRGQKANPAGNACIPDGNDDRRKKKEELYAPTPGLALARTLLKYHTKEPNRPWNAKRLCIRRRAGPTRRRSSLTALAKRRRPNFNATRSEHVWEDVCC